MSEQEQLVLPNDLLLGDQWHLNNQGKHGGLEGEDIGAFSAWQMQSVSPNVVVAIIDGGIDLTHPDLKKNIWQNAGEIPLNGIDDDGNGYVDDVNGWNFVLDNQRVVPDDHGTHVAGIIGAEGDNLIGVAGVTWDVQLMSLDIFAGQNKFSNDDLIDAIYYAVNNGADIINMSIGYTVPHASLSKFKRIAPNTYSSLLEAFKFAVSNNVTIISAAGNSDSDDQSSLSLPSAFGSIIPGFVTVAALDNYGYLTDYSNYGSKVSIAAPGGSSEDDWCGIGQCSEKAQIISTVTGSKQYGGMPGTSMAAPVVAGSAALMIETNNSLAPAEIEEILQISGDNRYDYDNYVMHGRGLNLAEGLNFSKNWDSSGANKITIFPDKYTYNGTNKSDHFVVESDAIGPFEINSFGTSYAWENEFDSLFFSANVVANDQLESDEIYFESVFNRSELDQAKTSTSTFVYHRPSGSLYLNSNGPKPGWSFNNTDSPLIEFVENPDLMAENIKVFIDQYEYRIPSTMDNSGSSIPYAMHADEYKARHLWETSGKDGVINYFIDKKGVYGMHVKMPRGSNKFIAQSLKSINENTSLVFKKSKMKNADLILGSVSKYKHAHYQYEDWGGSSAWIKHKKRGSKMSVEDKVGASYQIGNVLGLILTHKTIGIYDFTDSVMAYDFNYENFNGFTQSDFITIDKIWSTLS